MKMANMDDYFDVVIIGTGAAGLYCALNLPARYRILLLTKQKADESDSFLAQGGICMQHGEADYRPFFDDTMRAGHYENNPATVDLMIRSSNSIIRDLVRRGVRFARDDHGALRFTREGAHSRPRILFHEDITGHEITQTLLNEVLRFENIELREHTTLLDFLFGKVLTYKKAVVVATILSICFLPWKLVENPESYVYTLNGTLAVFLGPITGICLAALWSQYRNRLRLPDLYYQDGGAYYYQGGWNVLALVTMAVLFIFIFVCQFIPVLRWIYDSSYLLGCVFAFVIYSALCKRQDR